MQRLSLNISKQLMCQLEAESIKLPHALFRQLHLAILLVVF